MMICDLGVMKDGLLAVRLPAWNILEMRLVLVSKAAYTTVKQKPAPNLRSHRKLFTFLETNQDIRFNSIVWNFVYEYVCMSALNEFRTDLLAPYPSLGLRNNSVCISDSEFHFTFPLITE